MIFLSNFIRGKVSLHFLQVHGLFYAFGFPGVGLLRASRFCQILIQLLMQSCVQVVGTEENRSPSEIIGNGSLWRRLEYLTELMKIVHIKHNYHFVLIHSQQIVQIPIDMIQPVDVWEFCLQLANGEWIVKGRLISTLLRCQGDLKIVHRDFGEY